MLLFLPRRRSIPTVRSHCPQRWIVVVICLGVSWGLHLSVVSQTLSFYELIGPDFCILSDGVRQMDNDAEAYCIQGRLPDALLVFETALYLASAAADPNQRDLANLLLRIGGIRLELWDIDGASAAISGSLRLGEQHLGKEHPVVGMAMNVLGLWQLVNADFEGAISSFETSVSILERAYGENCLGAALCRENLGCFAYPVHARYVEGLAMVRRSALAIERTVGSEHPLSARNLCRLASFYRFQRNYPKAQALCERALSILEREFGHEHPVLVDTLNEQAQVWIDQEQFARALPLLERSARIKERLSNHPSLAVELGLLADVYDSLGEHDRALPLRDRAWGMLLRAFGSDHPVTAQCLDGLAELYQRTGDTEKALNALGTSLQIKLKAYGREHPQVEGTLYAMGQVFLERKDYTNALTCLLGAVSLTEVLKGKDHPDMAAGLAHVARFWAALGRYDLSLPYLQQGISIAEQAYGPDQPDMVGLREGNCSGRF